VIVAKFDQWLGGKQPPHHLCPTLQT